MGEKRRTGHLPHPWFASAARSSTQRGSIWAGYASPSAVKTLAAARIHFPRAFKYRRVRQAFGLRNPKRKTRLTSCLFLKCQINLDIYSPKDPDFCPAAHLRRTSVFAAGENLGAGRIHSARACKIKGWRPPPAARTQKERHDVSRVFLFGAGKGNRTLIFSLGS